MAATQCRPEPAGCQKKSLEKICWAWSGPVLRSLTCRGFWECPGVWSITGLNLPLWQKVHNFWVAMVRICRRRRDSEEWKENPAKLQQGGVFRKNLFNIAGKTLNWIKCLWAVRYHYFLNGSKCGYKFTVSVLFRDQILYRYYKGYLQFRLICDMLEKHEILKVHFHRRYQEKSTV